MTVKGKGPKRKVTRSRARRGLRFRFSSDDPSASFECRLDKGEWKPCASPKRVRRAKLGRHTLRVRAGDARGNVEARPVHWRWKVVGYAIVARPTTRSPASRHAVWPGATP